MSDKVTMTWTSGRGNKVSKEVKLIADARDLVGLAGYPWVIVAANPHLSSDEIERFLSYVSDEENRAERSLSWIKRHRWMFRRPKDYSRGPQANEDGKQDRALTIMHANPKLSVRELVRCLKDHGIKRGREWVRKHRCDPLN